MTDTKHSFTPGPWHFAYDRPSLPIVCTENTIIALVRTGATNEVSEIEANARLIASAPELLEALIQIMAIGSSSYPAEAQWFPNFDGVAFSRGSAVWEQAQAAIAKATKVTP